MTRTQAGQRFCLVRMHRANAELSALPYLSTPLGGEVQVHTWRYRGGHQAAAHNTRHCTRCAVGMSEASAKGLMLRQLYSNMGETGVPVLPRTEGWACPSPVFVLDQGQNGPCS